MNLAECCGSSEWLKQVQASQPFTSKDDLHSKAERIWNSLSESDWLEAFAAHPKIGERSPSQWSTEEQSGMSAAAFDLQRQMSILNEEYARKFGFIFIVNATGKTAEQIRALLETRLQNNRQTELQIAAREQAAIMHLRLDKLTWEFPHTS